MYFTDLSATHKHCSLSWKQWQAAAEEPTLELMTLNPVRIPTELQSGELLKTPSQPAREDGEGKKNDYFPAWLEVLKGYCWDLGLYSRVSNADLKK